MECVIKYSNLWEFVAKNFCASVNTNNVSRVVKRSENAELINCFKNTVVNKNAFCEAVATLNNSVTDSTDFGKGINNLAVACCKGIFNNIESNL